jgi:radical SAM superfamily enzyme YgiQ (UPF0313 family)
MPYALRDPEDVARQIRADRQPMAVFVDNNLGASRGYLRRLCAALCALDTIWTAAVTLDVTDDPALVREMSLAGCAGVFIGFETLNDDNLASANKRSPRAEDYARRVRIFRDHGIQVNGSFVVGFDGDRRDVFTTLAEWIDATRLECATFHILTPYPGTPLFRQMEAEDRLLHRDWALYDTAHVVHRPKHLTPEELQLGYEWLYRRLFAHASIWARRPAAPSQWPAYLAGACLYKHANRLWPFLIRHRLVHAAWRPLVELARRRHMATRHRLLRGGGESGALTASCPGCHDGAGRPWRQGEELAATPYDK